MSDQVLLSLISTLGTIAVGIISLLNNRQINRVNTKVDANTKGLEDNTKITNEMSKTVDTVKTQTDGIKDELVQKTKELGEAIGKALGRAEQKSETENNKLKSIPDAPIEVKVVNEPLHVIPEEPLKADILKVQVANEPLKVIPLKEGEKGKEQ